MEIVPVYVPAGTGAQVGLRFKYPAPRGVGERPGAAGYGISTNGSAHTLVLRSLKLSTDGKEHWVSPPGSFVTPVSTPVAVAMNGT